MKKILALALVAMVSLATPAFAGSAEGGASWYSLPGSKTASGAKMNPNAMTAAHKSLPFGTKVKVTNLDNGAVLVVTINDRGPFVPGRIIDVSKAAAVKLGFKDKGHTKVRIDYSI